MALREKNVCFQVIVHIKVEDINDSPPVFDSDCLSFYVPENSPIGTTIGEIHAHDPDEGANAVVHYSIKGIFLTRIQRITTKNSHF